MAHALKDEAFARSVHREEIVAGAEGIGMRLDDHIEFVLGVLRSIAPELGLGGAPPDTAT